LVSNKELRILAFTGAGEDVFIRHYEVGELADTAEKNIAGKKKQRSQITILLKNYMVFTRCY